MTKKKYVAIRVPKEIKVRIKTAAAKEGVSMIQFLWDKVEELGKQK